LFRGVGHFERETASGGRGTAVESERVSRPENESFSMLRRGETFWSSHRFVAVPFERATTGVLGCYESMEVLKLGRGKERWSSSGGRRKIILNHSACQGRSKKGRKQLV